MKKVIWSIAMVGLCAGFGYTVSAQDAAIPTAQQEATVQLPTPPQLSSDEANQDINTLAALLKDYQPAIQANDSKMKAELVAKIDTWQQDATRWQVDLSPEDKVKFEDYMNQVNDLVKVTAPQQVPSDLNSDNSSDSM